MNSGENLAPNSVSLHVWMGDCFFSLCEGDLENRAQLREPANILIFNTTRSDTAEYRCEVAAIDDQRDFDEILISLAVRGTVAKLSTWQLLTEESKELSPLP